MRLRATSCVIALSLVGAGCNTVIDSGHGTAYWTRQAIRNAQERHRNHTLAEQAWKEVAGKTPKHGGSADYAEGFKEGFADHLYRGTTEPPPVPPKEYRAPRYQTPDGYRAGEEWLAGFRHGVQEARARGLREWITGPSSMRVEPASVPIGEPVAVPPITRPVVSAPAPIPPAEKLPAPRSVAPPPVPPATPVPPDLPVPPVPEKPAARFMDDDLSRMFPEMDPARIPQAIAKLREQNKTSPALAAPLAVPPAVPPAPAPHEPVKPISFETPVPPARRLPIVRALLERGRAAEPRWSPVKAPHPDLQGSAVRPASDWSAARPRLVTEPSPDAGVVPWGAVVPAAGVTVERDTPPTGEPDPEWGAR